MAKINLPRQRRQLSKLAKTRVFDSEETRFPQNHIRLDGVNIMRATLWCKTYFKTETTVWFLVGFCQYKSLQKVKTIVRNNGSSLFHIFFFAVITLTSKKSLTKHRRGFLACIQILVCDKYSQTYEETFFNSLAQLGCRALCTISSYAVNNLQAGKL